MPKDKFHDWWFKIRKSIKPELDLNFGKQLNLTRDGFNTLLSKTESILYVNDFYIPEPLSQTDYYKHMQTRLKLIPKAKIILCLLISQKKIGKFLIG